MTTTQHLATERLVLRGLLAADKPFISGLIGHGEVRRFLGGPVPPARHEAAISRYCEVDEEEMAWMVETKSPRRLIGMILISKYIDGEDFEISFMFHPDYWGRGYALEATRRASEYALNELALRRLVAETQSANSASCRLLERLGMKELRRVERFGAEQSIYAS